MRTLTPGRSLAHAFGAELRRLRIEHGLSQAGLGELVHHSGALIGKIEKAERLPTVAFCQHADAALETGGTLTRMCPDRGRTGEMRRHVVQHQRVTRLAEVLEAVGVTLDGADRELVDRFAAKGREWFEPVVGWLTRAASPDPVDGEPDGAVVTGSATPVTRVTVQVFAAQDDAGDLSRTLRQFHHSGQKPPGPDCRDVHVF